MCMMNVRIFLREVVGDFFASSFYLYHDTNLIKLRQGIAMETILMLW